MSRFYTVYTCSEAANGKSVNAIRRRPTELNHARFSLLERVYHSTLTLNTRSQWVRFTVHQTHMRPSATVRRKYKECAATLSRNHCYSLLPTFRNNFELSVDWKIKIPSIFKEFYANQRITRAYFSNFYRAALNAGRSSQEKAVCPSVKRVHYDKTIQN